MRYFSVHRDFLERDKTCRNDRIDDKARRRLELIKLILLCNSLICARACNRSDETKRCITPALYRMFRNYLSLRYLSKRYFAILPLHFSFWFIIEGSNSQHFSIIWFF